MKRKWILAEYISWVELTLPCTISSWDDFFFIKTAGDSDCVVAADPFHVVDPSRAAAAAFAAAAAVVVVVVAAAAVAAAWLPSDADAGVVPAELLCWAEPHVGTDWV